jgi:rubrerythrin
MPARYSLLSDSGRKGEAMASLKGSKTHDNLKDAFAGESQANRRYLYFAKQADIEGYPDVGGLFRDTAEAETGHAHGHLDYLKQAGDPPRASRSAPPTRTSPPRWPARLRVHRDVPGHGEDGSR